jgi:hypothetical protein
LPDERAAYGLQVTRVRSIYAGPIGPEHLTQLGFSPDEARDLVLQFPTARPGPAAPGVLLNASSEELRTVQLLQTADTRFAEVPVHLQYGQQRQAVLAFQSGLEALGRVSGGRFGERIRHRAIVQFRQAPARYEWLRTAFENVLSPKTRR